MKEVLFIEGQYGAGKDYFLDHAQKYFPNTTLYYAPKSNLMREPQYNSSFITYNTIFNSIEKDSRDSSRNVALIYRSPLTAFVCKEFYERSVDKAAEVELRNLFFHFFNRHLCKILCLSPDMSQLREARPNISIKEQIKMGLLYSKIITDNNLRDKVAFYTSFDEVLNTIQVQVKTIQDKTVFMDVDDTMLQYENHFRHNWPNGGGEVINAFVPSELQELGVNLKFITGRKQSFPAITSPISNLFASSYNYKYAFFKLLIESTSHEFVWYDDFIQIQAQLADEFPVLQFSTFNTKNAIIGRLARWIK